MHRVAPVCNDPSSREGSSHPTIRQAFLMTRFRRLLRSLVVALVQAGSEKHSMLSIYDVPVELQKDLKP